MSAGAYLKLLFEKDQFFQSFPLDYQKAILKPQPDNFSQNMENISI